jgi:dienelactone hydrolase
VRITARLLAAPAAAVATLVLAVPAEAAPARVRDYDLGRVRIATPGPFGPLPVRLWGALGVPVGPGPHPVVLVLHGRHGTGCPAGELDGETWPCFRREQRHDLGMRFAVKALARRGIVALAPDLNGAYTGGWGEPDDRNRWPRIVNRTLAAVAAEATVGSGRFPLSLEGKVDLGRLGLLGHSLSGFHAVRSARRRAANGTPVEIAAGRGPVRALFLLAPVPSGLRLPDVPAATVVGSCDGDTDAEGRRYFDRARRATGRTRPVFLVRLERANHNFFNRNLARQGADDAPTGRPACRPPARPSAAEQRRWLGRAAADFFASMLRGARRPGWLRVGAPRPRTLYGLPVRVRRGAPG